MVARARERGWRFALAEEYTTITPDSPYWDPRVVAKGSDGLFVGQAYGGYKGFPGFIFTGGRMPNPFITTPMVWDDDINPEGLAEQWKHTFVFGGEPHTPPSFSKDGKAVVTGPPAEPFLKLDVFANFGQFVYDDSNPSNPIGPIPTVEQPIGGETQQVPTANAFLLGWQVGAKFDFPHVIYFQLAPTLYNYTGDLPGLTRQDLILRGQVPQLALEWPDRLLARRVHELLIGLVRLPFVEGVLEAPSRRPDDRADAAGHPDKGGDRYAYEIGLGVGQLKKKHDWEVRAWWQHQDQFALDPNLVDSDLFDQRLNLEGVGVKAGYMLADAVLFNLTYAYAWRIDDQLGTGGTGNLTINPVDQYQIFQADLSFKF